MQRVIGILSSLFFPITCIGCGSHGAGVCRKCIETIPFANLREDTHTYALYHYGDRIVEKAVRDLKYHRKSEAADSLLERGAPYIEEWLGELLQSEQPENLILVPIPQHRRKTNDRGYNQSELLAQRFGHIVKNAKCKSLLEKTRFTLPQARTKSKAERRTNLVDSMRTRKDLDPTALYIVIDDVTTTGSTFAEASRALRVGGAEKILCVALAHGYARRK